MNNIYQQRINNALAFIEANLAESLPLELVAQKSYFSPFHFHRIFRGMMNETLNNYIARRRVEKAANILIVKPELSITDIAFLCGFSSSANFAKAFKKHFGFSASDIRQPKASVSSSMGAIVSKYGKDFEPLSMYPQQFGEHNQLERANLHVNLNVIVDNQARLRLCTLSSHGGYQPEAIFKTWEQLISWGEQHRIAVNAQQRLAICLDNPAIMPIDKCRYQAAIVINDELDVHPPYVEQTLPSGLYAICYVKGTPEQVEDVQKQLFSIWLPNSDYEPDNLPMIEHYLNDVRIDGFIEMNIMLKLKKITR